MVRQHGDHTSHSAPVGSRGQLREHAIDDNSCGERSQLQDTMVRQHGDHTSHSAPVGSRGQLREHAIDDNSCGESMSAKINKLKEELQRTKSELKEKEKELKSFKDRVAKDVALSIKTGGTQGMNNPVNQTRLIEMYEETVRQWQKIKKHQKSNNKDLASVENDIKEVFKDAMDQMKQKKKQIDKLFGLNEQSSETVTKKVQVYRQSTIQDLQLALFHKAVALKDRFSKDESENPENPMGDFLSHCHWLSCLMALNSPPLEPDWNNHDPGMDRWNIFPRKIIPVRR